MDPGSPVLDSTDWMDLFASQDGKTHSMDLDALAVGSLPSLDDNGLAFAMHPLLRSFPGACVQAAVLVCAQAFHNHHLSAPARGLQHASEAAWMHAGCGDVIGLLTPVRLAACLGLFPPLLLHCPAPANSQARTWCLQLSVPSPMQQGAWTWILVLSGVCALHPRRLAGVQTTHQQRACIHALRGFAATADSC